MPKRKSVYKKSYKRIRRRSNYTVKRGWHLSRSFEENMKFIKRYDNKGNVNAKIAGVEDVHTEIDHKILRTPFVGRVALKELTELNPVLSKDNQTHIVDVRKSFDVLKNKTFVYDYLNQPINPRLDTQHGHSLSNYYRIDMCSAYPATLISRPMPTEIIARFKNTDAPLLSRFLRDPNVILASKNVFGIWSFDSVKGVPTEFAVFKAEYLDSTFVHKWFGLRGSKDWGNFPKKMLVSAIGALHRYTDSVIPLYVWHSQYKLMELTYKTITDLGGIVIHSHTDSFGFVAPTTAIAEEIGKELEVLSGEKKLGRWTWEVVDQDIEYYGTSKYHVRGEEPKLAGYGWKRDYKSNTIEIDGVLRNFETEYPIFHKGCQVTVYNKGEKLCKKI